ncbi:hypothetical protein ACFWZ4_11350 [Frateuria sp. GZRe12]|uniref:hypothetical protein n=1 Tax=Frateuria sp. GZRe12 TaxID=3351533 RepID=UPI003EDB9BD4
MEALDPNARDLAALQGIWRQVADAGAPRPMTFRTVPGLTMRAFVRHAPAAAAGNTGR